MNNKTESSHKYSGNIKKRSLVEAPYHRDVNWLTTSLVIRREIVITIAICYLSGIFIQIIKINKYKYISYLTKITWGYEAQKADVGCTAVSIFIKSQILILF